MSRRDGYSPEAPAGDDRRGCAAGLGVRRETLARPSMVGTTVPDAVASLPLPPRELANLSGKLLSRDASFERYGSVGRDLRDTVVRALPEDWSGTGARLRL